jgi:hypothetical protein
MMAEKLQALTQLRLANTRMKDYFDLWLLSRGDLRSFRGSPLLQFLNRVYCAGGR